MEKRENKVRGKNQRKITPHMNNTIKGQKENEETSSTSTILN